MRIRQVPGVEPRVLSSFTPRCPGIPSAQQNGWCGKCSTQVYWGHEGSETMDAQLVTSELGL